MPKTDLGHPSFGFQSLNWGSHRDQSKCKLNQKILKEYTAFYNAEDTKDCFDGKPKTPSFTIDDMGIDFDEDKINFNVSYGLPDICLAVDGTIISLSLEEIEPYLKK
jgi:hypothetical protein